MEDPRTIIRSSLLNMSTMLVLRAVYICVYYLMLSILRRKATYVSVTGYALIIAAFIVIFFKINRLLFNNSLRTGYALTAELRRRLSDHLRKLPLSFFKKNDTARISGHFLHEMTDAEVVLCSYIHDTVAYGIIIVLFGAMLCVASMPLGLTVILTSLTALPVIFYATKDIDRQSEAYIDARALADKTQLKYLGGISELKVANMTDPRFSPWRNANEQFRSLGLAIETRFGKLIQIYLPLLDASFVFMLFIGSWLVADEELSLPVFLFFLLLIRQILPASSGYRCLYLRIPLHVSSTQTYGGHAAS